MDETTDNFLQFKASAIDASKTGGFTVAMWVNPGEQIVAGGTHEWTLFDNGQIGFNIKTGGGDPGKPFDRVLLFWDDFFPNLTVGSTTLETGNWYHVAFVSEDTGGAKRLYVDGALEIPRIFDPSLRGSAIATVNGWSVVNVKIANDGGRGHDSKIDDVRIYNAALSDGQIQGLGGGDGTQRPGDCSQDAATNIADAVCTLDHLFLGSPSTRPCDGGTVNDIGNLSLVDANGDGTVNLADPVYLLGFLFLRTDEPALGTNYQAMVGCPGSGFVSGSSVDGKRPRKARR